MKHIMKMGVAVLFVLGISLAVVTYASSTGAAYSLHTVESFTETLIERGIIPDFLAAKARSAAGILARMFTQEHTQAGALNADKVAVSFSQLIQYANLTYDVGDDIRGPIILVKNTTKEDISLAAKRRCQVVYRIFDASESLVYDSGSSESCQTEETVMYILPAEQSRMFPIVHLASTKALASGRYRFELDYPGYGTGDVLVTVQ